MFHINDNSTQVKRGQPNFDPWHKIRPILDHLNSKFKQHFVPGQLVSIDESMVSMKNRHIYIQYLPNKRHSRFGMKKIELCDSITGYCMHVELYSGGDFAIRGPHGQGQAVVIHLMKSARLLGKGYHLITDNFYTKPRLAHTLFQQKTCLTGTVRSNSKGFPKDLAAAKLDVGEVWYRRQGPLLAAAYRDKLSQKKPVCLLSTSEAAGSADVTTAKGVQTVMPIIVNTYNTGMGGVDLMDKKIYHMAAERSTHTDIGLKYGGTW